MVEVLAFEHILIGMRELGNEVEDEITLGLLGIEILEVPVLLQIVLLELNEVDDGLPDERERLGRRNSDGGVIPV